WEVESSIRKKKQQQRAFLGDLLKEQLQADLAAITGSKALPIQQDALQTLEALLREDPSSSSSSSSTPPRSPSLQSHTLRNATSATREAGTSAGAGGAEQGPLSPQMPRGGCFSSHGFPGSCCCPSVPRAPNTTSASSAAAAAAAAAAVGASASASASASAVPARVETEATAPAAAVEPREVNAALPPAPAAGTAAATAAEPGESAALALREEGEATAVTVPAIAMLGGAGTGRCEIEAANGSFMNGSQANSSAGIAAEDQGAALAAAAQLRPAERSDYNEDGVDRRCSSDCIEEACTETRCIQEGRRDCSQGDSIEGDCTQCSAAAVSGSGLTQGRCDYNESQAREACKDARSADNATSAGPAAGDAAEDATAVEEAASLLLQSYVEKAEALSNVFTLAQAEDTPGELPEHLSCRIMLDILRDPVITPSGVTYERSAIEEHLKAGNLFDPVTRRPLLSQHLIPNRGARDAAEHFLHSHGWAYRPSK
ncbi:unnamed protein product, partial [Closterium sp. Yama58-4]